MLVQIAYKRKLIPSQLKGWSQNLGHESLLTNLSSYGDMPIEIRRGSALPSGRASIIFQGHTELTVEEPLTKSRVKGYNTSANLCRKMACITLSMIDFGLCYYVNPCEGDGRI